MLPDHISQAAFYIYGYRINLTQTYRSFRGERSRRGGG